MSQDVCKSGQNTPNAVISKKELIENDLFLNTYYDDWEDWRDGLRDWFSDFKTIKKIHLQKCKYLDEDIVMKRIRMNQKQKKLLKIRAVRKRSN